jgi:hypothetical protein
MNINKITDTQQELLALLNNAEEILRESFDVQNVEKVLRALVGYAKMRNFKINEEKVAEIISFLYDKPVGEICKYIYLLGQDIIKTKTI